MMRNALLTILATVLAIAVVGGALAWRVVSTQPTTARGPNLNNTNWILVELNDAPALPETTIFLNFSGTQVSGSGGVNQYFGNFEKEGDAITFSPMGSTEMAGPEPLMTQEQSYLRTFEQVRRYEVVENELHLLDVEDNVIMRFTNQNSFAG